jgi:tetratricopeptide (TPR) repeat protein
MSDQTTGDGPSTIDVGVLSGPAQLPAAREKLALEGFEVLGMLGQGGMGVVYKARQRVPSRLVALKMILAGAGATPKQITRFKVEAEALGRLQHPNIVQVHSAGEAEGYPFIALEYIDGQTLAQKWKGLPQPPREVAVIVRTLALAIEHAHQREVVHRDLKPGNVLLAGSSQPKERRYKHDTTTLDDDSVPKISDFGLAKQLDEEFQVSLSGQLIGTPSYMAPEQAVGIEGTVGPAVDIYALGAILYNGLTGRAPFRGETDLETFDQVRFQEPVPPRQLVPKVPVDLETVCQKCLQKDPAKRYASALDLAEDLTRYLESRPIVARPVSRLERVKRWCRRNPMDAALLACLVVALSLGFFATVTLWLRADRQRRIADLARAEAESQRQQALRAEETAKSNEAKAKESAAESRAVLEFFQKNVLAAARPKGKEGGLGKDATIRAAVDAAEPSIAKALAGQPLAESAVRFTLGATYYYLWEPQLALKQYDRALFLREQQLGPDHPDVATLLNQMGMLYDGMGQYAQAESCYLRSLKIEEDRLGNDDLSVADSLNNLGTVYYRTGQYAKAEPLFVRSLNIRERKLPDNHADRADSLNNLANLYRAIGQYARAEPYFLRSLKIKEETLGPGHLDVGSSLNNLGLLYRDMGEYARAEPYLVRSLKIKEDKLDRDHPKVAHSLNSLGNLYMDMGQYAKAEACYRRSLTIRETKLGRDHPEVGRTVQNLADLYSAMGRYGLAEPLFQRALMIREKLGKDHPQVAVSLSSLARLNNELGRPDKAEPLLRRSLQIREAKLGKDHVETLAALRDLADCLLRQDKVIEAEPLARSCLALRQEREPDLWTTFETKRLLGLVLFAQKKYIEAEPLLVAGYQGMRDRESKIPAPERARLSEALKSIVMLYDDWGKKQEAGEWRKRLLSDTAAAKLPDSGFDSRK